jgi:hypothetical protein
VLSTRAAIVSTAATAVAETICLSASVTSRRIGALYIPRSWNSNSTTAE